MRSKKQFSFENAPFDKYEATYVQIIQFCTGKEIPGYSKKVGFEETVDPVNCLTNFILRMYIRGYLRPHAEIDPVKSITYSLNRNPYTWIVTCSYDYFDLNPEYLKEPRLIHWLNAFYQDIESRKSLDFINRKYHRRGRETPFHELDINGHCFFNPLHLARHVQKVLERNRYPIGHVIHFYQQSKRKFFEQQNCEKADSIVDSIIQRMKVT